MRRIDKHFWNKTGSLEAVKIMSTNNRFVHVFPQQSVREMKSQNSVRELFFISGTFTLGSWPVNYRAKDAKFIIPFGLWYISGVVSRLAGFVDRSVTEVAGERDNRVRGSSKTSHGLTRRPIANASESSVFIGESISISVAKCNCEQRAPRLSVDVNRWHLRCSKSWSRRGLKVWQPL